MPLPVPISPKTNPNTRARVATYPRCRAANRTWAPSGFTAATTPAVPNARQAPISPNLTRAASRATAAQVSLGLVRSCTSSAPSSAASQAAASQPNQPKMAPATAPDGQDQAAAIDRPAQPQACDSTSA